MAASTSGPSNGASARTARRRTAGLSPQAPRIAGSASGSPRAPSAATAASRAERVAMVVDDTSQSRHRAGSDGYVSELTDRPRGRFHDGDVGVVEQVEHCGDDRGVRGHRRRELGDAAAHRWCGIGTCTRPRGEGVAGRAADERAERGGAHSRVGVTGGARGQPVDVPAGDGGPVTEGGELGRTRDRARIGHGNRPLIAITMPAKTVATTAATMKPVTPTRKTMRAKAIPRCAARTLLFGPGRAPSGTDGVAG